MGMYMKKINDFSGSRENVFDVIRLFAAFLVLYAHAYHIFGLGADPLTPVLGVYTGTVAVFIFFCISGFFITKSAVERNTFQFVTARCVRIIPGLLFCNIITILFIIPLLVDDRSLFEMIWSRDSLSYITDNTSLLWGLKFLVPGVLDSSPDKAINGSLWTLPIEVQAYMLAFVFSSFGLASNKIRFNLVFAVILYLHASHPNIYNIIFPVGNSHVLFLSFLFGAALFVNRNWFPMGKLCLLVGTIALFVLHHYAFGVISLFVLCYLIMASGWVLYNSKLRLKNDYSYGVYLYAYPMSQLSYHFFNYNFLLYFTFIVLGVSLLSVISWHYVEQPIMRASKYFLGNVKWSTTIS